MTYEVAFSRVPSFVGRSWEIKDDPWFEKDPWFTRPFVIREVSQNIVTIENEVETFTVARVRIATLYCAGRMKEIKKPEVPK